VPAGHAPSLRRQTALDAILMGGPSPSTASSDRAPNIDHMVIGATTLLPDGPGDVWSILFAAVAFALLFAVVRVLERV
jgi:hypothetical protein